MAEERGSNLLAGFVLGAAVGAGVTWLFGTPKGKQVRNKLRSRVHENFPELLDQLDEITAQLKDLAADKYDDLTSEVEKIEDKAAEVAHNVKEKSEETISHSVLSLGEQVESLGQKIQSAAPSGHTETNGQSKKRFFVRKH